MLRPSWPCELFVPDTASSSLQESEQVLAKLYWENPNNLMVLRDLADCYRSKGDLASHGSNWQQAKLGYQRSLELWEQWPKIGTSSIFDQHQRELALTLIHRRFLSREETAGSNHLEPRAAREPARAPQI
jgi:hypothetical protein